MEDEIKINTGRMIMRMSRSAGALIVLVSILLCVPAYGQMNQLKKKPQQKLQKKNKKVKDKKMY